jgi:hypothetical protein
MIGKDCQGWLFQIKRFYRRNSLNLHHCQKIISAFLGALAFPADVE